MTETLLPHSTIESSVVGIRNFLGVTHCSASERPQPTRKADGTACSADIRRPGTAKRRDPPARLAGCSGGAGLGGAATANTACLSLPSRKEGRQDVTTGTPLATGGYSSARCRCFGLVVSVVSNGERLAGVLPFLGTAFKVDHLGEAGIFQLLGSL